jgi:HSP20 family protein
MHMARFLIPSIFDAGLPAARGSADPFLQLHREVNRLFDDTLRGQSPASGTGAATITPRMNVSETGQEIRIEAELPGVPEQDVHVELNGDMLTISGEKRAEREDAQHHLVERSFGSFARTVRLPFAPSSDQVRATFEHGVLRVTLPKAAPESRSRRIPVQAATPGAGRPGDAEGCLGTPAAVAGHPTPNTTQGSDKEQGGDQDEATTHQT